MRIELVLNENEFGALLYSMGITIAAIKGRGDQIPEGVEALNGVGFEPLTDLVIKINEARNLIYPALDPITTDRDMLQAKLRGFNTGLN